MLVLLGRRFVMVRTKKRHPYVTARTEGVALLRCGEALMMCDEMYFSSRSSTMVSANTAGKASRRG